MLNGVTSVTIALLLLGSTACAWSTPPAEPALQASSTQQENRELKKSDLKYDDRAAWRSVLKWPDSCESSFRYSDKSFAGLAIHELSRKLYLAEITCNLGAYQGIYLYYLYDQSTTPPSSVPLKFTTFVDSGVPGPSRLEQDQTDEVLGVPEFDSQKHLLTVFNKFRGKGDCGILTTYTFPDRETRLLEARAKLDCDGKGSSDPKQWKPLKLN